MIWSRLCTLQFYLMLILYTFMGLTPSPGAALAGTNDLVLHFAGYFVAAFSISAARPHWPLWQRAALLLAYSIAIEIAQHVNPPRTFSLLDIAANASGIAAGLIAMFALQTYWRWFDQLVKRQHPFTQR